MTVIVRMYISGEVLGERSPFVYKDSPFKKLELAKPAFEFHVQTWEQALLKVIEIRARHEEGFFNEVLIKNAYPYLPPNFDPYKK